MRTTSSLPTSKLPVKKLFGCMAILVVSVILFFGALMFFGSGRALVSSLWRGNVYSVGYRDVYIQGTAKKADTVSGVGRVYELKASHHGYGAAVDPNKSGQSPQGAWQANYFDDGLFQKLQTFRGDTIARVFYLEKDVQFSGASNYEVLDVMVLPPQGEPMDAVLVRADELFKEYIDTK